MLEGVEEAGEFEEGRTVPGEGIVEAVEAVEVEEGWLDVVDCPSRAVDVEVTPLAIESTKYSKKSLSLPSDKLKYWMH